ncbi:hypothetical protein TNCV_539221 [Trichonephila clavipes]|nr:hypothetical protein TNCV_539221 [Trichonephila clavipes]
MAGLLIERVPLIIKLLIPPIFSTFERVVSNVQPLNHMRLMKRISNKKRDLNTDNITGRTRILVVAQYRLFIGHNCLATYLYMSMFNSDPYCPICRGQYVMDG